MSIAHNDEMPTQERNGHYEVTRFNAVRHGVLSRYTVLPWEDEEEYHSSIVLYNCNTDLSPLYIWAFDENTNGPWQQIGYLPAQYDATTGICPAPGSPPLTFTPQNFHVYVVVAIDPTWCGANDPTNGDCIRWQVNVEGDPAGPRYQATIA
jgi:hypothetical protein